MIREIVFIALCYMVYLSVTPSAFAARPIINAETGVPVELEDGYFESELYLDQNWSEGNQESWREHGEIDYIYQGCTEHCGTRD